MKRMQAEEARRVLQEHVDQQTKELSACSQKVAKERQELAGLRFRFKEPQAKNADYQVKPMAAKIEELNAESQRLRDEITELKGIREPGKGNISLACPLAGDAIVCARDRECEPMCPCAVSK
eukprot:6182843-Pleurochrysis_carterae.AAC.1